MNVNLIYKIAVTVDTLLALYINITTEHHNSQYSSYRDLLQWKWLALKWLISVYYPIFFAYLKASP